jgi:cobalamin biosynthesis protein CobT
LEDSKYIPVETSSHGKDDDDNMQANIVDSENPTYDEAELEDVQLDEEKKKDSKEEDIESDEEEGSDKREEDEMSASFQDEEASTVDLAEKREQEVRKSLLFALLTAVGMVFCFNMIGRLIERFSRSEDTGADEVVAAGQGGVDAANNQAA